MKQPTLKRAASSARNGKPSIKRGTSSGLAERQTYVPRELHQALKAHAALADKNLTDVYETALKEFLSDRQLHLKRGEPIDYLASPRSAKLLNLRFAVEVARQSEHAAEEDDIATSRVFYTALVRYARKRDLLRARQSGSPGKSGGGAPPSTMP